MDRSFVLFIQSVIYRLRDFPDGARQDALEALNIIEEKYNLQEEMTEEDRQAIEQSRVEIARGEFVTLEEVRKELGLENYDRMTAGKDALIDAISRVQNLPGDQQGDVADIVYALLNAAE